MTRMLIDSAAAQQALEALEESLYATTDKSQFLAFEAITALKAALAEPVQEQDGPICDGWQLSVSDGHSGYGVYAHMGDYPEEGAVLVLPIQKPVAVTVEAVAEVIEKDGEPELCWLIEGGIHALPEGDILMIAHRSITGDDGSGEVYTAPPQRPAEPVQEPVAWRVRRRSEKFWAVCPHEPLDALKDLRFEVEPLYTAPPQRKPLTSDKDRQDQGSTYVNGYGYVDTRAVRAVEAAHGIKE